MLFTFIQGQTRALGMTWVVILVCCGVWDVPNRCCGAHMPKPCHITPNSLIIPISLVMYSQISLYCPKHIYTITAILKL